MIAYNERIVATSESPQRQHRAERMLVNLRPVLIRLEREEADRLKRIAAAAPPSETFDGMLQRWRDIKAAEAEEFEVVWNGRMGHDGKAITENDGLSSTLAGDELTLHRSH